MTPHPPPVPGHGRRLLVLLTGAYFFAGLAALSFAPLLPFIQTDLALNKSQLGLFVSTLYFGAVVSAYPAGWIADRWGVRRALTLGLLLQGLALGVAAVLPYFLAIIVLVFCSGLGYGSVNPSTSKGIIHGFAARHRGTAMAVKQMGFTGGTMVAAAALPAVAGLGGWRLALIAVAALTVLNAGATHLCYPRRDPLPQAAAGAAPETAPDRAAPAHRDRRILFWSVICIFYAAVQMCGTAYLTVYLVEKFSQSEVMAGMVLGLTQGTGAAGRVLWARLSDLWFADKRHVEVIALGFLAAATCIVLGLLPATAALGWILLTASLFGLTAVGYNAVFLTYLGEIAGPARAGQAIGLAVTIAYLGVVLGPPIFGWGVDRFGYTASWVVLGSALAVAKVVSVVFVCRGGTEPARVAAAAPHP